MVAARSTLLLIEDIIFGEGIIHLFKNKEKKLRDSGQESNIIHCASYFVILTKGKVLTAETLNQTASYKINNSRKHLWQ